MEDPSNLSKDRSYILKPCKKANASKVARIQMEQLNSLQRSFYPW